MTFRKIMAFGATALAAVAMATPAAQAEAPEWYHEGSRVGQGQGNGKELHVEGKLSTEFLGGGGLVVGPCEVTLEGEAWNENGMSDGIVTGGSIQKECPTNVPSCTITPTMQNFPWNMTGITVTDTTGVEFSNFQIEFHYMGNCFPTPTVLMTGSLTGIVEIDTRCLSLEDHRDDLVIHALGWPTMAVDTLGTLCDTTLTLT